MITARIAFAFVLLSCACGSDDDDLEDDAVDAGRADAGGAGDAGAPSACGELPGSCALDCDAEPGAAYCAQQPYPQPAECYEFCYEGRCCACEDPDGSGPAWSEQIIDCA